MNNIIFFNFLMKVFKKDLVQYPTAKSLTYFWNYGSLAGLFLSIQLVTGFLLTLHYIADVENAFSSVELVMKDLNFGWFLRYIHSNGASIFFITIYIHILKALHFNSYLYPRHVLWSSGVVIFVLSMGTAFLGYVLPWGQMSFWAATVITNLVTVLPYIGKDLVFWIWGGFSINNYTLSRFYSLHFILPFVTTVTVVYHLFELHIVGSSNYMSNNLLTRDKINFFPYFVIKDLFGLMLLFMIFLMIIFFNPEYLGHSDNYIKANSLVTPSHIVPEWYFLPYYAVLRSILDKVYGIIFMGLSIGGLFLLPFLIEKYIKNNSFNFIDNVINIFLIIVFIMLGILGVSFSISPFIEVGCIMAHILILYYFLILPFFVFFSLTIFKKYGHKYNSSMYNIERDYIERDNFRYYNKRSLCNITYLGNGGDEDTAMVMYRTFGLIIYMLGIIIYIICAIKLGTAIIYLYKTEWFIDSDTDPKKIVLKIDGKDMYLGSIKSVIDIVFKEEFIVLEKEFNVFIILCIFLLLVFLRSYLFDLEFKMTRVEVMWIEIIIAVIMFFGACNVEFQVDISKVIIHRTDAICLFDIGYRYLIIVFLWYIFGLFNVEKVIGKDTIFYVILMCLILELFIRGGLLIYIVEMIKSFGGGGSNPPPPPAGFGELMYEIKSNLIKDGTRDSVIVNCGAIIDEIKSKIIKIFDGIVCGIDELLKIIYMLYILIENKEIKIFNGIVYGIDELLKIEEKRKTENVFDAEKENGWYLEKYEKEIKVIKMINEVVLEEKEIDVDFWNGMKKEEKIWFKRFINFVMLNGYVLPLTVRMYGIVVLYIQINIIIYIIFFLVCMLVCFIIELYSIEYKEKREIYSESQESFLDLLFVLGSSVIILLILILSLSQLYSADIVDKFQYDIFINVVGHQWYWTYTYNYMYDFFLLYDYFKKEREEEEKEKVKSVIVSNINMISNFNRLLQVDNMLMIPVETWIGFGITSNDVIHSWSVPNFGIKQDAIPGRVNLLVNYTHVLGIVHGQCSELCGVSHGFMPIVINVMEKEQFFIWFSLLKNVSNEKNYRNLLKCVININI